MRVFEAMMDLGRVKRSFIDAIECSTFVEYGVLFQNYIRTSVTGVLIPMTKESQLPVRLLLASAALDSSDRDL